MFDMTCKYVSAFIVNMHLLFVFIYMLCRSGVSENILSDCDGANLFVGALNVFLKCSINVQRLKKI